MSAFLTREGLAAEILRCAAEKATLYTAEVILQEVYQVLLEREHIRKKYIYTSEQVEQFLAEIRALSSLVASLPGIKVVERDPKDDVILACALEAKAQYLISRDPHLLDLKVYQGIRILSPEDFIQVLRVSSR